MRAIGYVRVSKSAKRKGEADQRHSINAQRQAIERAATYNGWNLLDIVEDNGKTGTNTRRQGFQDVLAMLKAKQADMLVIAKYDRLSRSTRDVIDLMETSVKQGWALSVLDQKVDTSTAVGRLMARTMASHAEFERDLISERTRDALAVVKANGRQLGKPSTIPEPVQKLVMGWQREGITATAIARRLTEEGVPTPRGGKQWNHAVITALIRRKQGEAA